MPTVAATRRLSPKVRGLLQEAGLAARSIAGTGTGGRVTPRDVLGAAGVPRRAAGGTVLASPLARRLLRDAGVDLATAARANDGRRLSRAEAEQLAGELADSVPATHGGQASTWTSEIEVDVALLLGSVAAANRDFLAQNGFELSAEVALASAAAAVLVRNPGLAVTTTLPPPDDGRAYPAVHVGFPRVDEQAPDIAVVSDVQYLTVGGLARRARVAVAAAGGPAPEAPSPAVVVAADGAAPAELPGRAAIGMLTIGSATPRNHASVDHLGHEVVHARAHARVRLQHDDRTSPAAAAAFLEVLGAAVTSWSLPVGP